MSDQSAAPTASDVLASQTPSATPANVSQPAQQEIPKQVTEEPKTDRNFARNFSALSRKEREIRAREQAISEKEKASTGSDLDSIKKKIKLKPMETLKELGVDFDYLTRVALDDGKVPEQTKKEFELQEEIASLKSRLDKFEKSSEPATQEEQVLNEFIQGLEEHVGTNKEKYKLIVAQDAVSLVYDVIEQEYARSVEQGKPRILSYEESADMVEEYLRSETKKLAESLGFYNAPAESQGKDSTKPQSEGSSSSQTLSNQLNTTKPTEGSQSRLLTREEALARAAARLQFT